MNTTQDAAMSDQAFQHIADIAIVEAGLSIPASKKALVQSRVSKRMRRLGITGLTEYLEKVDNTAEEKHELVSILTTNVSSFFREQHHFEHLTRNVLPKIAEKLKRKERVRIWSAGCSSGQEPYTIGMELLRSLTVKPDDDILILATDIDPEILKKAVTAQYSESDLGQLSSNDQSQFVEKNAFGFTISEQLKKLVRFKQLNLHAEWPMKGPFDVVFCRNVLIYFDDAHQSALWPRFKDILAPQGFLYLGHSERIHPLEGSGFASQGATIYQKTT